MHYVMNWPGRRYKTLEFIAVIDPSADPKGHSFHFYSDLKTTGIRWFQVNLVQNNRFKQLFRHKVACHIHTFGLFFSNSLQNDEILTFIRMSFIIRRMTFTRRRSVCLEMHHIEVCSICDGYL